MKQMVAMDNPAIAVIVFDGHLSVSKLGLNSGVTVKDGSE